MTIRPTHGFLVAAFAACSGGGDDGGEAACLDEDVLVRLDDHAEQLRVSADLLAGHPGAREATGFFHFPGLEVQRAAVFAGPLIMECAQPLLYDELCEDDGLCSRIECTGDGAGWVMHFRLAAAVAGDISYDAATVDTAWADGDDGITFAITSTASDAARGWSVVAAGRMDTGSFDLEETYAGLVDGATVVMTLADTTTGGAHSGAIAIDGEVVAAADPGDGRFAATGACAP